MEQTVMFSSKELCAIVSKALQLPEANVVPTKYGVGVKAMAQEEVERRMNAFLSR